jgi:hypothetical protein
MRNPTRVLYLDDSGKPHPRDSSKAVVIAGFSIPSENARTLHRRVAGAKGRFFPQTRGTVPVGD